MANFSATSRAVATPELLELILSHLPPGDVLLAQRISKSWQTLISNSPTLQTLLYFRPPSLASTTLTQLNPLLTIAFPFLFTPSLSLRPSETADWDLSFGNLSETADWDLSFGHLSDPPSPGPSMRTAGAAGSAGPAKAFKYSGWVVRPEAWRRKEASWRGMFISKPPVAKVRWRKTESGMMGCNVSECVVRFGAEEGIEGSGTGAEKQAWMKLDGEKIRLKAEGGLRMGVLYDYLEERVCRGDWPTPDFDIQFEPGLSPPEVDGNQTRATGAMVARLEPLDAESEAVEKMFAVTEELELVVSMFRGYSCIMEEEEAYPIFRSEGFRSVEVGPWREVSSQMWD
ncbi:hypothetical protein BU26DRAFT_63706 [Trematosphaeria pertusa]|uniref:F-box domain-containing protein n=1 Tax=Trematosphaeria pertusa TaxID=390896 RepID=A0A6A6I6M3_9PLEO|nr:uncharacterized protein BU26DRAFT_63706 [Trematosphaeria pertusa]KAF2246175.1 hypothetical protein BU26DRAFT_63706 [Trematosphaeria pertusa]